MLVKGAREMATLCKNCSHALIYDPGIKMMLCTSCGSTFKAEEVESEAKKYREDERVSSRGEIYGDDNEGVVEKFLENYIYTCSECGGEIVIHGSEASTKCVFCGNANVVFSRVSKEKMPDLIIPFSITKERALSAIREKIAHSIFVPTAIKNFQPEDVRGIYLPYWIVETEYQGSCRISSKVSSGKYTKTVYTSKRGNLHMKNFPVDGCAILSNESSSRLEPFNTSAMIPFDEDYLLGFYSNASDITYDELWRVAGGRAHEIFTEAALNGVRGSSPKIESESHTASVPNTYKYAMFPVWFVTFTYEGTHNTILVNGQTGKVVCGLPWRKTLFWAMTIGIGIALAFLSYFLFKALFTVIFEMDSGSSSSSSSSGGRGKGIVMIAVGIFTLFATGAKKMKKVIRQIELTQSGKTFNFVKKRQE